MEQYQVDDRDMQTWNDSTMIGGSSKDTSQGVVMKYFNMKT